jgi:hypothetical protein
MVEPGEPEVLRRLHGRLGRAPDPRLLDYAIKEQWIDAAVEEVRSGVDLDEAVDGLLERYRGIAALVSERSPADRPRMELGPDARGLALADIFAIDASRSPEVAAFRREVLHDRLLAWEEVGSWIATARAADRPGDTGGQAREDHRRPARDREKAPRAVRVETLSYLLPGSVWPHVALIGHSWPLRALRDVSSTLPTRYGWVPSEATTFVLTGLPPLLPRIRAQTVHRSVWPAATIIELEISPRTAPSEVAAVYRKVRSSVLGNGRRSRKLAGSVRAELAVHAFRLNDGRTWREAMEAWNAGCTESRRYQDLRSFTRDCREAFLLVTGEYLDWLGRSHRSGRPNG